MTTATVAPDDGGNAESFIKALRHPLAKLWLGDLLMSLTTVIGDEEDTTYRIEHRGECLWRYLVDFDGARLFGDTVCKHDGVEVRELTFYVNLLAVDEDDEAEADDGFEPATVTVWLPK